jgi:hypothetical protein
MSRWGGTGTDNNHKPGSNPRLTINRRYNAMNLQQSEKLIADLRAWYREEIHRAAADHGGLYALSKNLGYNEKYLWRVLDRNSFSALRRVVKKIHGAES